MSYFHNRRVHPTWFGHSEIHSPHVFAERSAPLLRRCNNPIGLRLETGWRIGLGEGSWTTPHDGFVSSLQLRPARSMSWCPIPDDPWELEEYGIGTEDQLSKIWPYPIKKEVQWISRYLIYLSIYIYIYIYTPCMNTLLRSVLM